MSEEAEKQAINENESGIAPDVEENTPKSTQKTKKKKSPASKDETVALHQKVEELNEKYIRLSAEYDNYRKRTLKEKMELVKSGGEGVLLGILPVVDNMERAIQVVRDAKDLDAVKEGIDLIYNKFKDFLTTNGVKEIDCLHQDFDSDIHEAVTKTPTPQPELKGKVVDVIEKGYYLHDRIIRYAKVVVGE